MRDPEPLRRARGNLSYRQFIALVDYLWTESHPDIPLVPVSNELPAHYPSIVYAVMLSKTHPDEPKPRFREIIDKDTDTKMLMAGQRFQYVVSFSAVTRQDAQGGEAPYVAEAVVEAFENFMQEMVPVLKQSGLSEITYARRLPDKEENRPGDDAIWRSTSYMVTVEKLTAVPFDKLRKVSVDVRRFLDQPYEIFIANEDNTITVLNDEFIVGDQVKIWYRQQQVRPESLLPGIYTIDSFVMSGELKKYRLSGAIGEVEFGPGSGFIAKVYDDVDVQLTDQQASFNLDYGPATPDQDF